MGAGGFVLRVSGAGSGKVTISALPWQCRGDRLGAGRCSSQVSYDWTQMGNQLRVFPTKSLRDTQRYDLTSFLLSPWVHDTQDNCRLTKKGDSIWRGLIHLHTTHQTTLWSVFDEQVRTSYRPWQHVVRFLTSSPIFRQTLLMFPKINFCSSWALRIVVMSFSEDRMHSGLCDRVLCWVAALPLSPPCFWPSCSWLKCLGFVLCSAISLRIGRPIGRENVSVHAQCSCLKCEFTRNLEKTFHVGFSAFSFPCFHVSASLTSFHFRRFQGLINDYEPNLHHFLPPDYSSLLVWNGCRKSLVYILLVTSSFM